MMYEFRRLSRHTSDPTLKQALEESDRREWQARWSDYHSRRAMIKQLRRFATLCSPQTRSTILLAIETMERTCPILPPTQDISVSTPWT